MTKTTAEALALAADIAGAWDWITEIEQPEPNRLDIRLTRVEDLVPIAALLRVQRLGYLSAITGLDPGPDAEELEVLYHFCAAAAVITLRVRLPRQDAVVASLTDLIPSAEPFERELSEMYGIRVEGLTAPPHLYLPDEWPSTAYPMRKDFDRDVLPAGDGAVLPG